ncbi:hypothetical protein BC332_06939 [Capsicum chinense]|nr:hypothetical protein BC332_06939 [Capsicum chinense]
MDSRPTFNLGLNQLDAQEQDIFVDFVTGTFDYNESNFTENHSKQRNDPITMKKSKEMASSRSKKSNSKAASKKKVDVPSSSSKKSDSKSTSKKKVDESGRPCLPKYSYKNLQPTREKVRRLNLFFEDFKIFDPTSVASTSAARTLKRSADEHQPRVVTAAEDFDDFSTIPLQEILVTTDLASPLSPEQASKRRKIVMFQEDSPGVMDEEKSTHKDKGPAGEIINDKPIVLQHVEMDIQASVYTHTEYPTTIDGQNNQKDDVGGTITDLVQDTVDTLLFGLPTPSTTKPLNVGTLNTMIESQWMIPDSQFSPDFSDVQVSHKSTYKRGLKEVEDFKICAQEDYAESYVVANNEDAITNTINGFYIPAGLPWHMIDEVCDPVNCDKEFYWVLTVIVLKERVIRVYDSLSSKRKIEPPNEIQKLTVMLPTYLSDNDFFEKIERTDWSTLEAYKGKLGRQTGLISQNPFDIDYVQNIPQQVSDILDCGVFLAAYAEILSEGQQVHSFGFDVGSQHGRRSSIFERHNFFIINKRCNISMLNVGHWNYRIFIPLDYGVWPGGSLNLHKPCELYGVQRLDLLRRKPRVGERCHTLAREYNLIQDERELGAHRDAPQSRCPLNCHFVPWRDAPESQSLIGMRQLGKWASPRYGAIAEGHWNNCQFV